MPVRGAAIPCLGSVPEAGLLQGQWSELLWRLQCWPVLGLGVLSRRVEEKRLTELQ